MEHSFRQTVSISFRHFADPRLQSEDETRNEDTKTGTAGDLFIYQYEISGKLV
jgi:hypothetical protein